MLVSEFANILRDYCTHTHHLKYVYKGEPTTLYALTKINEPLNGFKFNYILKEAESDSYRIESMHYDIDNMLPHEINLIKSLYVEPADGLMYIVLTIDIN